MAKPTDRTPRGRFSKSGHTSHPPRVFDDPTATADYVTRTPPEQPTVQHTANYPSHYEDHHVPQYEDNHVPQYEPRNEAQYESQYQPPYADHQPPLDSFSQPTYHHVAGASPVHAAAPNRPAVKLTKAAASGTNRLARNVTRKVIRASKADGADESGLTALIWNQVLSYGTDAMITVALAGTVFFGASAHAQRGNVLLYLLVTMAPFALIAPVIGPALDRIQHGRRWTMAGTAIGRCVLALIMAAHPTELLVLYPCALGSLVLSKAYAVVRAAAAPRLVPPGMTLTKANARLTIFGLASTLVLGGLIGVVIKVSGSYSLGLWITAIAFAVCAFASFRLPKQVDSATSAARHPEEPVRPLTQERVPPLRRINGWAKRGFNDQLVIALQGESVLRLLSGLLTIYLAFYVESTVHGLDAALDLGAVVAGAGLGNFSGTAIGAKVQMSRPEFVIVGSVVVAAATCVVVAIAFGMVFAVIGMYISAVCNAVSKIALDSLIQRDVVEKYRSSAFGRSETFLQLAWVIGAAAGVLLPSTRSAGGAIGFWVAAVATGAVAVVILLRQRVLNRAETSAEPTRHPTGGHTSETQRTTRLQGNH